MSESLDEKLRSEIMATTWDSLVSHFARGALLLVAARVDLLEVAEALARDDAPAVEAWVAERAITRASDDDARSFAARPGLRFQFAIVQPWVIAQVSPSSGGAAGSAK